MLFAVLVNCLGVNVKAVVTNYGCFSDCWIVEEGMKFEAWLRSWWNAVCLQMRQGRRSAGCVCRMDDFILWSCDCGKTRGLWGSTCRQRGFKWQWQEGLVQPRLGVGRRGKEGGLNPFSRTSAGTSYLVLISMKNTSWKIWKRDEGSGRQRLTSVNGITFDRWTWEQV